MFTTLGAPRTPADVVDLLLECHERIRAFTAVAVQLAAAHGAPAAEISQAAERVRRYFAEALPLHAEDEEASILPRLRGRDADVDRELEAMHREHDEHGALLREVVGCCAALAADPSRHAELAPFLAASSAGLERHFEAHLAREERVIFPAIRRLLAPEAREEIAAELRARRAPAR
jgi:iron-sulfur cluster repair protein YtfE (RIC family)